MASVGAVLADAATTGVAASMDGWVVFPRQPSASPMEADGGAGEVLAGTRRVGAAAPVERALRVRRGRTAVTPNARMAARPIMAPHHDGPGSVITTTKPLSAKIEA